jgi:hypothetical protein
MIPLLPKTTQANVDYHKESITMVEVIVEYGGAGLLTYFLPSMIKKELESTKKGIANAQGKQE